MKNKIVQEVPNYCDVEPKSAEFNTLAELLEIDWVKSSKDDFYRWSLSGNRLMEESDEGRYWWVVGYVARPDLLDLPKWVAVEREKQPDDGREIKLMFDGVECTPASGEFVSVKRAP